MSTLDTDTIHRRRTATLNTYWHDGASSSRALAWLLATVRGGHWITEARIWRHITFDRIYVDGEDAEVLRIPDWRPIENEHGWSSTELILVRIAAQLADQGIPPLQVAAIGDLFALDEGNWDAVRRAIDIERDCRGPDSLVYLRIADAFDQLLERRRTVPA